MVKAPSLGPKVPKGEISKAEMGLFQYHSLLGIVSCPFAARAGVRSVVQRGREGPRGERRGLSPARGALGGCKAKPHRVSAPHWSWGPALGTAGPLGTRTSVGPTLSRGHACTELCPPSAGAAGSHTAGQGFLGVCGWCAGLSSAVSSELPVPGGLDREDGGRGCSLETGSAASPAQ